MSHSKTLAKFSNMQDGMKGIHCKKSHHAMGKCKNGYKDILFEYKNVDSCANWDSKSDTCLALSFFRHKKFHLKDPSFGQYLKVERDPMYLSLGNALYERYLMTNGRSGRESFQNQELTRFAGCNNFNINNTDTICTATNTFQPNHRLFYDRRKKTFIFRDTSQSRTEFYVERSRSICYIHVLLKNNEEVAVIKCGSGYLRTRGRYQIELDDKKKTFYHIDDIIDINDRSDL